MNGVSDEEGDDVTEPPTTDDSSEGSSSGSTGKVEDDSLNCLLLVADDNDDGAGDADVAANIEENNDGDVEEGKDQATITQYDYMNVLASSSDDELLATAPILMLNATSGANDVDDDCTTPVLAEEDVENQSTNQAATNNDSTTTMVMEEPAAAAVRPMYDIEQAIDLLVGSCAKVKTTDEIDHGNDDKSYKTSKSSSSSQFFSCSSTAAHGGLTVKSKEPLPLNETMSMSSDEENGVSSSKKKAAAAVPAPCARHHARKSGAGATMTNHRRNVIAAGVVSVALVVLVGLGLGLGISNKNDNASSGEDPAVSTATANTVPNAGEEGAVDGDSNGIFDTYTAIQTEEPSTSPSNSPTSSPSSMPLTPTSTPTTSTNPTSIPSTLPTSNPSSVPSLLPSSTPTSTPTSNPSSSPTTADPTSSPSTSLSPTKQFVPGEMTVVNTALDIRMSTGLSVKKIAQTHRTTTYANGQESSERFHEQMDGAGIVSLPDGGYVYVSNSEIDNGGGGVYGLYFDKDGNIINYKTLLANTNRNCGGGLSPWNTWITCEETTGGQCWQVDPNPDGIFHESPRRTLLGGDGGKYETVTCDNRNPDHPVFFTTEDDEYGSLRRFEADSSGWDSLHTGGSTTFLRILNGSQFEWTTNESAARSSAAVYYRNAEGIIYHEGKIYFVAKKTRTLFVLDLQTMTYESETSGAQIEGRGSFNAQPDQIVLGNYKRWIYFTEDGGSTPGVYVRERDGSYHTLFEGLYGGVYDGDETVGIALSPDRMKMYAGFQDAGVLMEFTRDDGLPFQ